MKCGSLFSGVGGFDLGLERAGMRVLWQVEYDKQAQQVLRHRFPNAEPYTDVRDVGVRHDADHIGPELEQSTAGRSLPSVSGGSSSTSDHPNRPTDANGRTALAPVDIIAGGFPCTDLSVAGKRAGLAGEKSGLWHEFHRIIGELAPRWVLIENVPGLLSSNGGEDFAVLLGGLSGFRPAVPDSGWKNSGLISPATDRDYGAAWRVLDSQYFGVPQRRRRVFIVGCLGNQRAAFDALFPVGTSLPGDPAPSRTAGKEVAGSIGGGSGKRGWCDDLDRSGAFPVTAFGWANSPSQSMTPDEQASTLRSSPNGYPAIAETYRMLAFGEYVDDCTASATKARDHKDATDLIVQGFHENLSASVTVEDKAKALRAGASANYQGIVQSVPRRLTPMETERLQGFPDGWTDVDSMKDGPRYRMMGNAVTVNVAQWLGERIMEVDAAL